MKFFVSVFILVCLFSCDNPVSEEEVANAAASTCKTKACVIMEMSDDLELTISVVNFKIPVSIFSFELLMDYDFINISSTSIGDFGNIDFESIVVTDSTLASFSLMDNIIGDGELITIQFQGSGYNGTKIKMGSMQLIDANGQSIEQTSYGDLWIEEICYIDEGILLYAESSPPGPVSESWEPTNNFIWSNRFCGWAAN